MMPTDLSQEGGGSPGRDRETLSMEVAVPGPKTPVVGFTPLVSPTPARKGHQMPYGQGR